jgi:hypothetical protein
MSDLVKKQIIQGNFLIHITLKFCFRLKNLTKIQSF